MKMTEMNDLLARIQKLEDLEEIRRLKHKYCGLCDAGFQAKELGRLFTEDGVWEAGEPYCGPRN
jgi:hypothetical protein